MGRTANTRIPASKEVRDEVLKPLKRGGETWDSLFRSMAEQYDPDTDPHTHRGAYSDGG